MDDSSMQCFAQSIPNSARHVMLDFSHCGNIGDTGVQALAQHLPTGLRSIKLVFTKCKLLSDVTSNAVANAFLSKRSSLLTRVDLMLRKMCHSNGHPFVLNRANESMRLVQIPELRYLVLQEDNSKAFKQAAKLL